MNARVWMLTVLLLGLSACAQSGPHVSASIDLDTLTLREPDAVRQRAARRLELAAAYYAHGQDDVAMQETRAALQIDPAYAQAFNLLGLIHQRQNHPALAEQSFAAAIKFATTDLAELGDVQHNYGWFLCERSQFARGQDELKRALAQPGYAHAVKTWAVLGECQQRAGQMAQAQNSWRAALALEPDNLVLRQRLVDAAAASHSVE